MSRYYDLGYEKGIENFDRDIYDEFCGSDIASNTDDWKDYMAGYFDGWCAAEEAFLDATDEMLEKAYQEGYEQAVDDYPKYCPDRWDKIKYFEDSRLAGYKNGYYSMRNRSENY